MIKTTKMIDSKDFENPHNVSARKLYDGETAKVIHFSLGEGEELKKHTTPVDVFFYVLEGTGVVEIGEEQIEVTKDTLIESPANIPHRLMNTGIGAFRFIVVKLIGGSK